MAMCSTLEMRPTPEVWQGNTSNGSIIARQIPTCTQHPKDDRRGDFIRNGYLLQGGSSDFWQLVWATLAVQ